MLAELEKEETVVWKGKTLTLKGFANMIPNMTQTDQNAFLDDKELVKMASDYLKAHPEHKIKKEKKK